MSEIYEPPLTEISRILKRLIFSYGNISGSELAKRSGIPVSTINRILAGTVIDPKISTLKPLADYFGISVDQLLGYTALPEKFNKFNQNLKPTTALPVYQLKNFTLPSQKPKQWFTWVANKTNYEDVFAISIDSDAFEPIFSRDSILIVEPSMLPPQDNDYVALIFENDNVLSIRKFKIEGNDHYLVPLNPQLKASFFSDKRHQLIGIISEAHTKLREV